jgi:hypothetical protein
MEAGRATPKARISSRRRRELEREAPIAHDSVGVKTRLRCWLAMLTVGTVKKSFAAGASRWLLRNAIHRLEVRDREAPFASSGVGCALKYRIRGCGSLRFQTASCCRRARFSMTNSRRERNDLTDRMKRSLSNRSMRGSSHGG